MLKKSWLKANLREVENIIHYNTYQMDDPYKGESATPFMYVYKSKIQYDGSLDKLKLIIVVRGYFYNKEMIGDTRN